MAYEYCNNIFPTSFALRAIIERVNLKQTKESSELVILPYISFKNSFNRIRKNETLNEASHVNRKGIHIISTNYSSELPLLHGITNQYNINKLERTSKCSYSYL